MGHRRRAVIGANSFLMTSSIKFYMSNNKSVF